MENGGEATSRHPASSCGGRMNTPVAPAGSCTLTNGTPYSIDSLSSGCSTFDLYAHHLRLVASGESVCSIAQRRYSMNSEDCGVTAAEEYMYIAALIAAVSLFRIHCHMARTVLEISHSLSNKLRIAFNLANFA